MNSGDYNDLIAEALRAQASEDALRERVRVLEEAINHHRSMLCGPGFDKTADVILWEVIGC